MIKLVGPLNSGAAVGADGAATANATSSIIVVGKVLAAYVKYNDSPPAATTDVTVTTLGTAPRPPAATILSIANGATDAWKFPRAIEHLNSAGSDLTTHTPIPIADKVKVTIAGANAGDNVDVWLMVEE